MVIVFLLCCFLFFFFKQKTAYEMRISDWSSDVCSSDLKPTHRWWRRRMRHQTPGYGGVSRGEARALFVIRDNDKHRNDIEQHYLKAIRDARSRLLIANDYFFTGYRVLWDICNAARRGVRVRMILTGEPDVPLATFGDRMLSNYVHRAGVGRD